MAATPAVEVELSSRSQEASKRRLSCGTEEQPPVEEEHHPGSLV
jgi:hypothetical protein